MKSSKNRVFFLFITLSLLSSLLNSDVYAKAVHKSEAYKYFPEDHKYVEQKRVALTFDDGPHPKFTTQVLDILNEKKVKATFFVVGFRAAILPDLILKIQSQECEIGNHTYNHIDLSETWKENAANELNKCGETIFSITGTYPKIYRPPFGKTKNYIVQDIEMDKILWDIDSCDWKTPNKDKIIKRVLSSVEDGDIILMHDFYEQTVLSLPEIIDGLLSRGFTLVTVSELMG